jgi:hypothetical protein
LSRRTARSAGMRRFQSPSTFASGKRTLEPSAPTKQSQGSKGGSLGVDRRMSVTVQSPPCRSLNVRLAICPPFFVERTCESSSLRSRRKRSHTIVTTVVTECCPAPAVSVRIRPHRPVTATHETTVWRPRFACGYISRHANQPVGAKCSAASFLATISSS